MSIKEKLWEQWKDNIKNGRAMREMTVSRRDKSKVAYAAEMIKLHTSEMCSRRKKPQNTVIGFDI